MTIRTQRLSLEPAPLEFIDALNRADRASAQRVLGVRIDGDWFDGPAAWMERRIRQLTDDPALTVWLVHAMILGQPHDGMPAGTMVGHCGYHGAPDGAGMVEVGYQVAPPYRRRGFAIEAVGGLIANAFAHPPVSRVRASISPLNGPSLALVAKLGFARVGQQIDEVDGLEYIFELARPEGSGPPAPNL